MEYKKETTIGTANDDCCSKVESAGDSCCQSSAMSVEKEECSLDKTYSSSQKPKFKKELAVSIKQVPKVVVKDSCCSADNSSVDDCCQTSAAKIKKDDCCTDDSCATSQKPKFKKELTLSVKQAPKTIVKDNCCSTVDPVVADSCCQSSAVPVDKDCCTDDSCSSHQESIDHVSDSKKHKISNFVLKVWIAQPVQLRLKKALKK